MLNIFNENKNKNKIQGENVLRPEGDFKLMLTIWFVFN